MNKRINKNVSFLILAAGIIVLAAAVNILFNLFFGHIYFDLTTDKRYSLSDESKAFLENNKTPVSIRFYIAKDLAQKNALLGQYADYLRKLLIEYQKKGSGMIDLAFIEVVPFASTQTEAERAGIKEFDFNDGKQYLYLGASFTNAAGKTLSIPQFRPEEISVVENEITRMISVLTADKAPVLGVVSPFFKVADEANPLKYTKNWSFVEQLKAAGYRIVSLREGMPFIPEGIDAVLVFYPLDINSMAVYALDQYLMRGGNVMIMADVFAEERFRGQKEYVSYNSGLQKFLQNSGVTYRENILAGDNVSNRELILEGKRTKYPFYLTVTESQLAQHPLTKGVKKLFLNHSGFFDYDVQSNLRETILFATNEDSGIMRAEVLADLGYEVLLKNYQMTQKKHSLAILLEGKFKSMYKRSAVSDPELLAKMPPFLSIPMGEGRLLLLGDSDMAVFGESSDNQMFLRQAADYLTGSGYVNVPRKNVEQNKTNLADVFYQAAVNSYKEQRSQNVNELLEIRQKIALLKDKMKTTPPSIKRSKELEELQREEIIKGQEVNKVSYLIKERYESFLSWFAIMIIAVLPLVSILLAGSIYYCYNRKVNRQAGEYINE